MLCVGTGSYTSSTYGKKWYICKDVMKKFGTKVTHGSFEYEHREIDPESC